jgi:hypothetical protein
MTDRAVQPEAPLSDSEKLRGLALWFDAFDKGTAGAVSRVVFSEAPSDEVQRDLRRIADELEARAASQERPRRFAALMETDALSDDRFASQERSQPDYRPEFPNECGWVGALGWADYETPNGRPCTLPDDHEGPHQRNPVGASQERPQPHGPNDGCGELLWAHMEAQPGFSEEMRQAEAELAEGRGTPFHGVAQERPRPDTDGALRAALVRLIAAQDVNASVGERMAATTAARAALAGEEQWNNESPESGATATGSSATSAPFATRSGDEPTDCPRCHHESRWHRSGGCVATYRTVDGETPCRCRDLESEVGE